MPRCLTLAKETYTRTHNNNRINHIKEKHRENSFATHQASRQHTFSVSQGHKRERESGGVTAEPNRAGGSTSTQQVSRRKAENRVCKKKEGHKLFVQSCPEEELQSQDRASHRKSNLAARPENTPTAQCSVVAVHNDSVESVPPVVLFNKPLADVKWQCRDECQNKDHQQQNHGCLGLLNQPRIVTFGDIESSNVLAAFKFVPLIVSRSVRHWSADDAKIKSQWSRSPTRPINTYV